MSLSSSMRMGFVALPSFSSLTSFRGGRPTFRHVAWRAKQARCGASDECVETVEMEEMDEDLDDRELSDMSDSGLDPEEVVLMIEGLRESETRRS